MLDRVSDMRAGATAVVGEDRGMGVLVIGSRSWADRIGRLMDQVGLKVTVDTVPGYLMALGQVLVDRPRVAIFQAAGLDAPLDAAAQAMRRLAPETRLLLIQDGLENLGNANDVFDACLTEPVDADDLKRALAFEVPQQESGWLIDSLPECSFEDLLDQHAGLVDDDAAGKASRSESSGFGEADRQCGRANQQPPPRATRVGGLAPDDAAMTEAVMRVRGGVRDAAIGLIAQQSGLAGVAWADRAQRVPAGHVSVSLGGDGRGPGFGFLHAPPPADTDVLSPWAVWLGRWLALEGRVSQLRRMAMRDELTGLWNRRYFNRFLKTLLDRAADRRFYVSLMVFDIDDFKIYNDSYGHGAGDEILRETGRLMQSMVRAHDVVARIGGDEFAVIFWDPAGARKPTSRHPHDPIEVARRFQKAICAHRFPKLGHEAPGTLTISGGLAGFPWDGRTPEDLMERADRMALESKQKGKNAVAIGPGAHRNCESS